MTVQERLVTLPPCLEDLKSKDKLILSIQSSWSNTFGP